jgi:hypothetical protein
VQSVAGPKKPRASGGLIRDYAATVATAIQKGFLGPLARGKSLKVSVLEAESSRRRHDSKSFFEKVIFSKI